MFAPATPVRAQVYGPGITTLPGQREDMRATPDRRDDSDTFPATQQAGRGGDP